ncbi:hypothetical protein Cni_G23024 [Canna indica]|uniref:Uncharacterized protein n=1 Tax=Canna indica TaxID=4628 RepID=A0AAQ3KSV6_9LILI|nr:hypothetical protein Cni_G23024 [Canna indica]
MAFSCSCMPALGKVLPLKPAAQQEEAAAKEKKKLQKRQKQKQSNLDQAAKLTPSLPFHSRRGLL